MKEANITKGLLKRFMRGGWHMTDKNIFQKGRFKLANINRKWFWL